MPGWQGNPLATAVARDIVWAAIATAATAVIVRQQWCTVAQSQTTSTFTDVCLFGIIRGNYSVAKSIFYFTSITDFISVNASPVTM